MTRAALTFILLTLGAASTAIAQIPGIPTPPPPEQPDPQPQPEPQPEPPAPSAGNPGRLSIKLSRPRVQWGASVTIRGRINDRRSADGARQIDGVQVQTVYDEHPYGRPKRFPAPFAYTDSRGRYRMKVTPRINTRFRVCTEHYGTADVCSRVRTVLVEPSIDLSVHRSRPGHLRFQYRADGGDNEGIGRDPTRRARRAFFYVHDPLDRRYKRIGSAPLKRPFRGTVVAHLIRPIDELIRRGDRAVAGTKVAPLRGMGRPGRFPACGRPALSA